MNRLSMVAASLIAVAVGAQQPAPPVQNGALPFVSPDGKWITFTANRSGGMRSDLYVIGADGSGEKQLTTGGGSSGKWLNATKIYFSIPPQRRPGPADTTEILTISPAGGATETFMKVVGRIGTITPDGKFVVAGTGQMPNMRMTRIPRDGGSATDLTDGSLPAFDPAYSKDGKRIAYAQMNAIPSQGTRPELQIWVMNADGSGKKQLSHFKPDVDGNAQWPSWSPDGKWIAVQSGVYSQKREDNTAHIWLINAETGEMKKLAAHDKPYLDETPSFFPDGKRIAFQSDRTGRMEIWVMNVDGTGARQITR
jgi:Tol biopolymer transport system component